MDTLKQDLVQVKKELEALSYMKGLLALSHWDQEVYMPEMSADSRSKAISELSALLHNKFVALNETGLIDRLRSEYEKGSVKGKDGVVVAEVLRSYDRVVKFPESFIRSSSELTSRAQIMWAQARQQNNFKLFLPWLTKIVAMKREEAKYIGYTTTPYDALLDEYEPGMTTEEVTDILYNLRDFLVPFIKKIKKSKVKINKKSIQGTFPTEKQVLLNQSIAQSLGFDFSKGRLDASTHPFTTNFHPTDVRITTRYNEKDVWYGLGSTIHEVGHALYEQGLPGKAFGTALSESTSLGIHESQSRLWENQVGKSKEFLTFLHKKLAKDFPAPFKTLPKDKFYNAINQVKPSLVRTESDEVTYNLHIIIRFEIEKELIEGTIEAKDIPLIWNAKVKEYLGVTVPNDALGCLQDVHWSCGMFGYFPTYSLGNLYSAQIFNTALVEIPDLKKDIKKGSFAELREWLRKKVHMHGKAYSAQTLVKKITGEPLSSIAFTSYIEEKYSDIYKI